MSRARSLKRGLFAATFGLGIVALLPMVGLFALALPLGVLWPLALLSAALGGLVAYRVAGLAAKETTTLVGEMERLAAGGEPAPRPPLRIAEFDTLSFGVERLLDELPRSAVESYLTVEQTEDDERLKAQFLASMSHDLRSPLSSILGFSELLLRGIEGEITPRQRAEVELMWDRGQHLLRRLNEILDSAKVDSGKMELHVQDASPAELLRAAVQEVRRSRPESASERLSVSLQPGMQPIRVDGLRTTQLVTHLLNYALDRAPGSAITLRAREPVFDGSRRLIIELELPGALGPDEAAQLFDDFRQASSDRALQFGLPLAKRLAELHRGRLLVVSHEPIRFEVTLPV